MYFNLVYDQTKINLFDEQVRLYSKQWDTETSKVVSYLLDDNGIVNKFVQVWNSLVSSNLPKKLVTRRYMSLKPQDRLECKTRLNDLMSAVNNYQKLFSDDLFLSLNLSLETAKLNQIHFIFEDTIKTVSDKQIIDTFEDINRYVHILEDPVQTQFYHQITRVQSHIINGIAMLADDYDRRTPAQDGYLILDENILGKSFFKAVLDNDWDLIEQHRYNQQSTISSAVGVRYGSEYTNKVSRYNDILSLYKNTRFSNIDLTQPKYKLGDIVLGSPQDVRYLDYNFYYDNVAKPYPNLITCFISENLPVQNRLTN